MFTPQALKALLQCLHGHYLHNATAAGRGLLDGNRGIWHIHTAVPNSAPKRKSWEKCHTPYHCQTRYVDDGVATLLSMDSSPVTTMSTIYSLSGENLLVLRMRNHSGNKSTIASDENSIHLTGEWQTGLQMPVIVNAYNQDKVGVDVAKQY
jgi:hypothetical protein